VHGEYPVTHELSSRRSDNVRHVREPVACLMVGSQASPHCLMFGSQASPHCLMFGSQASPIA
jgi:hypothetical protein